RFGMSSIPKPLQPWTTELSLIHPSCWPLLGKLLPKLGSALFRSATIANDSQQPPDGFDGVTNRGTLSRLLPTEWGLFYAHSDEFYRRLVMGESQYLKPGFQQQHRPQAFYVLLDRGPDQYGVPFLIQFALLLVLARRAREAMRQLHVGFIQAPGNWIVATPDSLQQTIHPHRSHARVVPEMVTAWQSALKDQQIDAQSLWIAASPRHSGLMTNASETVRAWGQLLIVDADATVSEQQLLPTLSVLFHPRQLRLYFRLPADELALQLLRNPFKAQPVLVTAASASASINLKRFQCHPTARIAFFYTDHTLVSVRIPKQVRANCKRLKRYKQKVKAPLVGVWLRKNQTAVVQVDTDAIYCTGFFQQPKITIPLKALPHPFVTPQLFEVVPLAYTITREKKALIIIKDGDNQGFALYFQKNAEFVFQSAIALGPMYHEHLVRQDFFYSDGNKTLHRLNLENQDHQPLAFELDDHIHGLIERGGMVAGRCYLPVLPLMRDSQGNWVDTLKQDYAIRLNDEPLGGNQAFMLVKRGDRAIWKLPKRLSKQEQPLEATCLIEESEPIDHVIYQGWH
ncbi:MAG: hypothetical protein ABG776_21025, partial [Cyanobacteria bacterium J06555_13]